MGDWLWAPTLPEPVRIPSPSWRYSHQSHRRAKTRTWLDAWEGCRDGRWLIHAAARIGVDPRHVTRAACACARTALGFVPPDEGRPRRALEAAEAWTCGRASLAEVAQVRQDVAVMIGAVPVSRARNVAYSVYGIVARVEADGSPRDDIPGSRYELSEAVHYASLSAAGSVEEASFRDALASMADLVRREISTLAVLRAACATA